jgi:hypothetical protein
MIAPPANTQIWIAAGVTDFAQGRVVLLTTESEAHTKLIR